MLFFSCGTEFIPDPLMDENMYECVDKSPDIITNDCLDNFDCSFTFEKNKMIELENETLIQNGNKNVFILEIDTEGDPMIADDEFTLSILFEIDPSAESFNISQEDFPKINLISRLLCYCPNITPTKIQEGCLQGRKLSEDMWYVVGNLTLDQEWLSPYTFTVTVTSI